MTKRERREAREARKVEPAATAKAPTYAEFHQRVVETREAWRASLTLATMQEW